MIKSLVGQNSFLLRQALLLERNKFIAEYGDLALETIDVAEWETGKILDVLSAMPFLSPKRMIIMEGLAANKTANESSEKIFEALSDVTELIIVEPKIDKRSVFFKTLKKLTDLKEFIEIDAKNAPNWLTLEAKARGGSIAISDANYLVSRVGAGQQLLSSELNKLLLYDVAVTRTTIDLLTEQAPLSSIFDLIEAAFSGNVARAFYLYDDQRAQAIEPLAIEALFVWQLHILLLIKTAGQKSSDQIAAESGISPYVAKKSLSLASMRTYSELKSYVTKLAESEHAIKTVSVDPDDILKNFILFLSI